MVKGLSPRELGRVLRLGVRERRIELSRAVAAFGKTPEGDSVHDVRVALRRVEAAARLFKGFPVKGDGREARRMARDLRKSLSMNRQAEVSLVLARTLEAVDPKAVESLELLPQRAADAKAVVSTGRRIVALLGKWVRAIEGTTWDAEREARVARALRKRLREARRDVIRHGIPTRRTLHPQRIAGKALRYELELLERVDPAASDIVKASRRFQEALGIAHDWDETRGDLSPWLDALTDEERKTSKDFLASLARKRRQSFRKARREAEAFVKLVRKAKLGSSF